MDGLIESLLADGGIRAWGMIYLLLSVRYLVLAGAAVLVWYGLRRRQGFQRKIQQRWPRRADYQREIGYSFLTFGVFAAVAVIVLTDPVRSHTQIYGDLSLHGWPYFLFSLVLVLLIHDAYFYWMHRLMHQPKIYRLVHLTHHRSTNPTPWAAFAFHPLEAVAEAGIIVFIAFLFPVHSGVILLFVLLMTIYNVYGHLGWELYPKGFAQSRIGRWVNTSVSHNQHHRHAHSNYGLYFLWWDRWFGTLHAQYEAAFVEATTREPAQAPAEGLTPAGARGRSASRSRP